jgi:hypothetical protein
VRSCRLREKEYVVSRKAADLVDRILASDEPAVVELDDLRRFFSTTVRLYTGVRGVLTDDVDPLDGDVTRADAVVTACALLRAHHLDPLNLRRP